MDIAELASILGAHGIDASALALMLSRDDERIYQLMVPARDAVEQWRALRELVEVTGHWPVLGWGLDDATASRVHGAMASTTSILAESELVDLAQWQQVQMDEYLALMHHASDAAASDFFAGVEGEWPDDVVPTASFFIPEDVATRGPEHQLSLALVPTVSGWQVPAYLRFAAGSASPAIHTAMARRWAVAFGAEIVGARPDILEMRVSRPPATRDAALTLAKEQYIYCPDIVVQGTETIQGLAAALVNGTAWFFWWD